MDAIDQLAGESDEKEEISPTGDSDFLTGIHAFFEKEEKLGPPIDKHTADVLEAALRSVVPVSKQAELLETILRPENCDALLVPRINPEIWRNMKKPTRQADGEWRKLQQMISKAITAVIVAVELLRQNMVKEAKASFAESVKVLAMIFTNISTKRKELISPDLLPSYRQLCLPSRPVTASLFGDDLQKDIKEISETFRLGAKTASYTPRGNARGKPSFRGKGGHTESAQASGHSYGQFRATGAYAKVPYVGRGKSFRRRGGQAGKTPTPAAQAAEASGSSSAAVSGMPICIASLHNTPTNFKAGKTRLHLPHWYALTSDRHILDSVKGVCIDFSSAVCQPKTPNPLRFSDSETLKMNEQLQQMLNKGIIERAVHEPGEFISTIFCRPKKMAR